MNRVSAIILICTPFQKNESALLQYDLGTGFTVTYIFSNRSCAALHKSI